MSNDNSSVLVVKWSPRQVILATLFVVALLVTLLLLFRFRIVLLMLFVAILVGTALKPGVNFLASRGLTRTQGQVLIYVLLVALFLAFVFLALTPFLEQSTALTSLLSTYYNDARQVMITSQSAILRNLGWQLSPKLDVEDLTNGAETPPATLPGEQPTPTDGIALAFQYVGIAARVVFFFAATSLMAFYWTLESERAIRTLLLLFSSSKREGIREVTDTIESKLGAYLFGQGILMLAIGILSLIAYMIIGLPNVLVLALIAGIMEAVPTVGPILGAVPAVLVAASTDPTKIIWVVAASMLIQLAENNLLVPRVMDRSVGVNPLLTILSIAALSSLIGLPGAVLAVPIAAIVQYLINRFVISPVREPEAKPEGRDLLSYLRLQVQELANDSRKQITAETSPVAEGQQDDHIEEMIESLANDLDQLLAQVGETQV